MNTDAASREPDPLWVGRWKRISARNGSGVIELRVHRDEGSLIWDATAHKELPEALHAVNEDSGCKVVIVTGTGESFCNAMDLESFDRPGLDWNEIWLEGRALLERLVGLDIPVIAAVNGPARIHAELAVLADVVLASPDTVFADHAHFTRGSIPGDGVHIVWPALLGPSRGRYFLMTGAEIDASEALRIGFVHELHARPRLLARAWELARRFAQCSRPTLQYTRTALSMEIRRHFAEDLSHGLALQGLGFRTRSGIRHPGES